MMVKAGMMTSSPGPIPNASIAASSAAVPLQTAIPDWRFTLAARVFSNWSTNGPSDEIQPVSIHWARYFFSLPSSSGSLTAMYSRLSAAGVWAVLGTYANPALLYGIEQGLVLIACVRSLLDFDHLRVFQHLE